MLERGWRGVREKLERGWRGVREMLERGWRGVREMLERPTVSTCPFLCQQCSSKTGTAFLVYVHSTMIRESSLISPAPLHCPYVENLGTHFIVLMRGPGGSFHCPHVGTMGHISLSYVGTMRLISLSYVGTMRLISLSSCGDHGAHFELLPMKFVLRGYELWTIPEHWIDLLHWVFDFK